jgi:hypothetical protein
VLSQEALASLFKVLQVEYGYGSDHAPGER